MARRKLNKEDIFIATDGLLHELGYEGFHFKALADQLGVGRSTIYEYYRSKEDLITAYMLHIMEAFIEDRDKLDQTARPLEQLRGLLHLFMKHDRILLAIELTPHVQKSSSDHVQQILNHLWKHHHIVFAQIKELVVAGIKCGEIRSDLPVKLIEAALFQAISLNKARNQETTEEWANAVFDMLFSGIRT
ncbi:TetR/AcrR family transcriptional regulator [Shouchella patagoniensis]|uniref:TetR/AcrR family transcriptional regulator n=1 Tax=Shouchella patagoniensis TaxID=228576 RepID=UPI000995268F|nr:TetR/AcrR family transcriptional regulator [Shouchella patagoniensis]